MRFRLIDESGETVGELQDAEGVWAPGDQITFNGEVLNIVSIGGRPVSDLAFAAPLIVVRRL
jgi:hypothetical protein